MASSNSPLSPPRVIVTGVNNKTGSEDIILNTTRGNYPIGGALIHNLWQTNQTPADNNDEADHSQMAREIVNPNGAAARLIDFPPGEVGPPHRTNSVDYGVVLKGTITLQLNDAKSIDIHEGSLIVQRGTNHSWINNTKDWVRVLFVIEPAKPLVSELGDQGGSDETEVWKKA